MVTVIVIKGGSYCGGVAGIVHYDWCDYSIAVIIFIVVPEKWYMLDKQIGATSATSYNIL